MSLFFFYFLLLLIGFCLSGKLFEEEEKILVVAKAGKSPLSCFLCIQTQIFFRKVFLKEKSGGSFRALL